MCHLGVALAGCVCRQCVLMCHLGVALAGCVCRQCVLMCHLGVALAGCLCVSSVCTDVSPWCYSSWMSVCVVSVY